MGHYSTILLNNKWYNYNDLNISEAKLVILLIIITIYYIILINFCENITLG